MGVLEVMAGAMLLIVLLIVGALLWLVGEIRNSFKRVVEIKVRGGV